MKACVKCGEVKSLAEFYKHMGSKDGRRTDCKLCVLKARRKRYEADGDTLRERVKSYQDKNPEKVTASQSAYRATNAGKAAARRGTRKRYLEQTYGITPEQYDEMFARQGGRCAVCEGEDPVRYWTVDHDHVTGAVRGILCWHCNVGLGHFRDDISNLVAAADYLMRAEQRQETSAA